MLGVIVEEKVWIGERLLKKLRTSFIWLGYAVLFWQLIEIKWILRRRSHKTTGLCRWFNLWESVLGISKVKSIIYLAFIHILVLHLKLFLKIFEHISHIIGLILTGPSRHLRPNSLIKHIWWLLQVVLIINWLLLMIYLLNQNGCRRESIIHWCLVLVDILREDLALLSVLEHPLNVDLRN